MDQKTACPHKLLKCEAMKLYGVQGLGLPEFVLRAVSDNYGEKKQII